jgi:urea transporter
MKDHIKALFMGVGQVMLQDSAVVGLLFLIGLFVNSPPIAAYGLVGLLCGYLAAWKFPSSNQQEGLYGFNAILVGLAMGYFFGFSWVTLIAAAAGGAVSTVVMHAMLHFGLRPFTFPFIVTTWALIVVLKLMLGLPPATHDVVVFAEYIPSELSALSLGFGQVMFQENIITGVVFFAALVWHSRLMAGYALLGCALGVFLPLLIKLPAEITHMGLFAFNPVLCGIALADKGVRGFVRAVSGILLSILIMWLFLKFNLIALTFPFVLSTWIVLNRVTLHSIWVWSSCRFRGS